MPKITNIVPATSAQNTQSAQSRGAWDTGTKGTERPLSKATWRRCTQRSAAKAKTAGSSKTKPTTAPIEKFCWPITCLKMSVASTLKRPPITLAMPKSVMAKVKTTKHALIKPYLLPGKVTVRKVRRDEAPKTLAAS